MAKGKNYVLEALDHCIIGGKNYAKGDIFGGNMSETLVDKALKAKVVRVLDSKEVAELKKAEEARIAENETPTE